MYWHTVELSIILKYLYLWIETFHLQCYMFLFFILLFRGVIRGLPIFISISKESVVFVVLCFFTSSALQCINFYVTYLKGLPFSVLQSEFPTKPTQLKAEGEVRIVLTAVQV